MANEKVPEKTSATPTLWRASFTYVGPNGHLRNGTLIVEAPTASEAIPTAEASLSSTRFQHWRVRNVVKY